MANKLKKAKKFIKKNHKNEEIARNLHGIQSRLDVAMICGKHFLKKPTPRNIQNLKDIISSVYPELRAIEKILDGVKIIETPEINS